MFSFSKKCLITLGTALAGLVYALYPESYPRYPESDHYSNKMRQFFNLTPDQEPKANDIAKALWQMIFDSDKFMPPSPLPTEQPNMATFLAPSETAKFIWFGHSSLLARIADQTIFIDPVFADYASPLPIMMKRFQAPPMTLNELPEIDWVVYSHNHYDHLDEQVVKKLALQKTRFIVPLGMGVNLAKWGITADRIQELDWWQSLNLKGFELVAVPAKHNTGRGLFDKNKTLWCGYVFKTSNETFYFSGDSAFGDGRHFAQIGEKFGGFDLAFVENGQYNLAWIDNHMLPEQTAEAVRLLKAKRFMPIHWGAYPLSLHPWDEPVKISIPLVQQQGITPVTAKIGQLFEKDTPTERWWEKLK